MIKKYLKSCTIALFFTIVFSTDIVFANMQKNQELLSMIKADVDGDSQQETVELWGDQLALGSSYKNNLLLLVKNSSGQIVTAYIPTVAGGYACSLEKGNFSGKGEQVILGVTQGNAEEAVAYRIIDFANHKAVHEIFSGSDNFGVSMQGNYITDFKVELTLMDEIITIEQLKQPEAYYKIRGLYNDDGEFLKKHLKPEISKVVSLVATDLDKNGQQELLTLQNVQGLSSEDVIVKVAAAWEYKENTWKMQSQEFYQSAGKDNFNRNSKHNDWQIVTKQAVYTGNSIKSPLFVGKVSAVENDINLLFKEITNPFIKKLGYSNCELDYTITFSGENILSLVFFGVADQETATVYTRKPLNINIHTGRVLQLDDVFDTQAEDFLSVIRILTSKDKVDFSKGLPEDWYYNGMKIVFCQQINDKQWEEATVLVEDLQSFLREPTMLKK